MELNINDILENLPHRYPFLLVDRILEVVNTDDKKMVRGYKNVTFNEPFFQGHFPDEPVMPGVLILEAMGQVGCILLKIQPEYQGGDRKLVYLTSMDKVKFRKPVKPGDRLETVATLIKKRGNIGKFNLVATVDGEVVAEGNMGFVISSGLTL
ncbi:MAG: 3-hydroxyacyl-ACP dehydratase FabZ [Synergistaceae bacterium]